MTHKIMTLDEAVTRDDVAIWCRTQEEATRIIELAEKELGQEWDDTYWENCRENTCYDLNAENYDQYNYFKEAQYEIIPSENIVVAAKIKINKKLYMVTTKKVGNFYIVADHPTEAVNKLKKFFVDVNYGHIEDREIEVIKYLAETCEDNRFPINKRLVL